MAAELLDSKVNDNRSLKLWRRLGRSVKAFRKRTVCRSSMAFIVPQNLSVICILAVKVSTLHGRFERSEFTWLYASQSRLYSWCDAFRTYRFCGLPLRQE